MGNIGNRSGVFGQVSQAERSDKRLETQRTAKNIPCRLEFVEVLDFCGIDYDYIDGTGRGYIWIGKGHSKSSWVLFFDFLKALCSGDVDQWLVRNELTAKDICRKRNGFLMTKTAFSVVLRYRNPNTMKMDRVRWTAQFDWAKNYCVFERVRRDETHKTDNLLRSEYLKRIDLDAASVCISENSVYRIVSDFSEECGNGSETGRLMPTMNPCVLSVFHMTPDGYTAGIGDGKSAPKIFPMAMWVLRDYIMNSVCIKNLPFELIALGDELKGETLSLKSPNIALYFYDAMDVLKRNALAMARRLCKNKFDVKSYVYQGKACLYFKPSGTRSYRPIEEADDIFLRSILYSMVLNIPEVSMIAVDDAGYGLTDPLLENLIAILNRQGGPDIVLAADDKRFEAQSSKVPSNRKISLMRDLDPNGLQRGLERTFDISDIHR